MCSAFFGFLLKCLFLQVASSTHNLQMPQQRLVRRSVVQLVCLHPPLMPILIKCKHLQLVVWMGS